MSALLSILILAATGSGAASESRTVLKCVRTQEEKDAAAPATERVELRKDGGPGHGPDQPYEIREQGARDLERFIGGKQVVLVAPYDFFLLVLLVVLIVVLIIVL
jgi:hypothetical protein